MQWTNYEQQTLNLINEAKNNNDESLYYCVEERVNLHTKANKGVMGTFGTLTLILGIVSYFVLSKFGFGWSIIPGIFTLFFLTSAITTSNKDSMMQQSFNELKKKLNQ
ncbi:hypothetical protein LNTAR_06334 [Lentisphaera araneosa HTCC2155]|uniref:Uncharacterized protein n=1 Tax=Lentisphaera araneosa HTCC2155 TaxID=313628 RepID=A6DN93_9BACT|nr:hypothetical protein [Lentisphaera araneosa]EDM26841.1 hypothetical protein LNTAR_06334 [Lentisphaera araneosa HTCC2155]